MISFFYLVNLYGDVPLTIESDYQINSLLPRAPKERVYEQIISDLKDSKTLLNENYLDGTLLKVSSERVRPTKWAATALLARAYLYAQKPDLAEMEATSVINNTSLFSLTPLNSVFLKNSNEAIWQLQPVNTGWNTEDARAFVLTGAPTAAKPVFLSNSILNAFELNDQRKINWVNSKLVGTTTYYYPNKYKSATSGSPVTEYLMVLRLGEQYIIRAEARAQQNNVSGAQSDLNAIRIRSGLSNTTANDKPSLLTAILHERQVELFSEWGHRWLDLKRTNNVDAVMSLVTPLKVNGAPWKTHQQLYPIPYADLVKAPQLTQNAGY